MNKGKQWNLVKLLTIYKEIYILIENICLKINSDFYFKNSLMHIEPVDNISLLLINCTK